MTNKEAFIITACQISIELGWTPAVPEPICASWGGTPGDYRSKRRPAGVGPGAAGVALSHGAIGITRLRPPNSAEDEGGRVGPQPRLRGVRGDDRVPHRTRRSGVTL